MSRVKQNPAEYGGGLGALVTAFMYAAGFSAGWITFAGIAAGLIPAAVTYVVNHGGIKGVLTALWQGPKRR